VHELSIAQDIIELAEATAREKHSRAIQKIKVRLGEFTTIAREALEFAFDVAKNVRLSLPLEAFPCYWRPVLGRFTSGPRAPVPCDRVPSRARAREVPIRSARLISAVHSSGHLLATLGRLAQTHTHEELGSVVADLLTSLGVGLRAGDDHVRAERSPCASGCFASRAHLSIR